MRLKARFEVLRREESGFTLIELLAAMAIGTVVLLAAFMLLDRATSMSNEIADRADALQRGRQAMETVVRQIRSQVCLGDAEEPITYADANTITFYADLSDGSRTVERRTIAYEPAAKRLVERIYAGSGTYPDLTFPSTPTAERVLINKVEPILDGGTPRQMFRFYAFKVPGAPGELEQLTTLPLSPDDTASTVLVKFGFFVRPVKLVPKDRDATTLESDIYVRLADPSSPAEGPRCI